LSFVNVYIPFVAFDIYWIYGA